MVGVVVRVGLVVRQRGIPVDDKRLHRGSYDGGKSGGENERGKSIESGFNIIPFLDGGQKREERKRTSKVKAAAFNYLSK